MNGRQELAGILTAAESAAPVEAVDVVAENLRQRFAARQVSFLIIDLTGLGVVRLSTAARTRTPPEREWIHLFGSVYERVVRTQELYQEALGQEQRVVVPVTNRGDTLGLLEMILPGAPSDRTMEEAGEAAHALAYIVIANQRFTDYFDWGKRSRPLTLAAEIQHRLLPPSLSCEAAQFALSASLVPSETISGDTFDYTLDRDALYLSVTDTMGHDLNAALSATILVGALRRARCAGAGLRDQADEADRALAGQGRGHATGQLLRIPLHEGAARLVNAGHPWPLRVREGRVSEIPFEVDHPFGLDLAARPGYRAQRLDLRPGDRLVLLTDGMQERAARRVDLTTVLLRTQHLHPREAVLELTDAVQNTSGGRLEDDATVMCLDWLGTRPTKRQVSSGASRELASPPRATGA